MADVLRTITGTSQGASPIADGGARATIVLVANAVSQFMLNYFDATEDFRSLVAVILNPLLLLGFSYADKIDAIIQRKNGVETAPTIIKRGTELAEQ